MYIWNYSFSIIMFMLFRLIKFFLFKNNKINPQERSPKVQKDLFLMRKLKFFIMKMTFLQTLALILLYNNVITISYQSFLQLKFPFYFAFSDKVNSLVSIFFLFFALISSLSFYIVSSSSKKFTIKNFLKIKS